MKLIRLSSLLLFFVAFRGFDRVNVELGIFPNSTHEFLLFVA